MNEIQLTIAKQINAKELTFAKFKLFLVDETTIGITKGKKFVKISYNEGLDLYNIEKGSSNKNFEITSEKLERIYFDQLQEIIQNHFPRFQYVMENFFRNQKVEE